MNFKAACVFIVIMEVSLSQYRLMTTVTFYEEKIPYHLEFLEREEPVDLSSAAWQPPSLQPTQKQTDILSFSLPSITLVCSLVCVGICGFWCLKGRIFPVVSPLNGRRSSSGPWLHPGKLYCSACFAPAPKSPCLPLNSCNYANNSSHFDHPKYEVWPCLIQSPQKT